MSGLDFECEKQVWTNLVKIIPKTIIIFVSHRERVVQQVDHLIEHSSGEWIINEVVRICQVS